MIEPALIEVREEYFDIDRWLAEFSAARGADEQDVWQALDAIRMANPSLKPRELAHVMDGLCVCPRISAVEIKDLAVRMAEIGTAGS